IRDALAIRDPREGLLDLLELRGVPLETLELLRGAVQGALDEVDDEVLGQLAEALELEEGDLRLDHPELGQVPPRLRFLGAEGRAEAVNLAEGRCGGLEVELTRLRKVGLVAEVVGLEERGGPFDGRPGQDRRIDPD